MKNYQMWLKEEQKEQVLKYIQERRYQHMITMYCVGIVALLFSIFNFLDMKYTKIGFIYDTNLVSYWLLSTLITLVMFLQGIGKIFGKNSDYDCVKKDNYTLNIRKFAGKKPDTGKHPYFVEDFYGNSYQCINFLDWKHAHDGDMLICIELKNGKKYALLQKVLLEK